MGPIKSEELSLGKVINAILMCTRGSCTWLSAADVLFDRVPHKSLRRRRWYLCDVIVSMPGGRRGLVAPQNTFLENIIRRSSSQRK